MTNEQDEFLEKIRTTVREAVASGVNLVNANANRVVAPDGGTPPPVSAEDFKKAEEKATATGRALKLRDEQILGEVQRVENRIMGRIDELERCMTPAASAVNDAATSAKSAESAAEKVEKQQVTTNRALIVAIAVPTFIGIAGTLINRFAPPAREVDKTPPVIIYQAPPAPVPAAAVTPAAVPAPPIPSAGGSAR